LEYVEKKDLLISKFTLGTVQLGCNYGIANQTGRPSEQQSFEILKAAVANGVTSFDTASDYEESEKVLGKYFTSVKDILANPIITTKISNFNYASEQAIKDSMLEQVETSLEKLKLDRIPILMLHFFSDYKAGGRTATECLKELKKSGKINKIGISLYSEDDIDAVLKEGIFDAVQIPLNIFDHRLITSEIMGEFSKRDMIVFVRSVFLQGLFFFDPYNLPPNLEVAKGYLIKLQELAKKAGMNVAQLCTSFVKNLDGVTSLVIGCETREQILDNISLMENLQTISKEIYNEIFETFKEMPQKIINPVLWNRK
jgi:aryl-alcohol dehydrogenase-like predicted oxidoreductase